MSPPLLCFADAPYGRGRHRGLPVVRSSGHPASQLSDISSIPAFRLSISRLSGLSGCPVVRRPGCPADQLSDCPTSRHSGCSTFRLSGCPTSRLSGCSTFRLPGCPAARLSDVHLSGTLPPGRGYPTPRTARPGNPRPRYRARRYSRPRW